MQADGLVLRDIHQPPAPPWWPPAPGWWWLAAGILLVVAAIAWRQWWRHRRRRALERWFDQAVEAAGSPAARVAAMSELLRRAARRVDPRADTLSGEAWLRFLDRGLEQPVFAEGAGRALDEAAYRRQVATQDVDALRPVARARFLDWMAR